MKETLVIRCGRCGGLLLAKADQKTRECPHCNFTITVQKARVLASAGTANEASIKLRQLKQEAAQNNRSSKLT
jgi:DNA-directed RNA polymerase subunit RPC12/RpoP